MKTYLVAGGAGFIGSHLCEKLLSQDFKIICVDNLITGDEGNISNLVGKTNFVFINHNIIENLPNLAEKIDGIFHLASPASPNAKSEKSFIAKPIETLMVNSLGTKNLLDLTKTNQAKFIYASSSEVYGDPRESPQKEDYFGNVNPNGVRSVYDEGKRFGEALAMAYKRKFDARVCIIRIFNTYGDRMQKEDGRVVSNFINQALSGESLTIYGDGSQTRSFCYVDDMVDGLISAMNSDKTSGMVINLGNPQEYKISDLAQKIKEMIGSSSNIVYEDLPQDDPKIRKPDISRAKEILGFEPKVSLDEGLTKTIEYFKELKN